MISMTIPTAPEDLPERIRVLRRQEETTSYRIFDYLDPSYEYAGPVDDPAEAEGAVAAQSTGRSSRPSLRRARPMEAAAGLVQLSTNAVDAGVNENWRCKICEWSCELLCARAVH